MGITASQNPFECNPAVPARFIGEFASLAALEAAHPTAPAGSYAVVNQSGDDLIYYYSVTDGAWFTQSGIPGSTPGINAVLTVDDTVTTKDQIFELSATEFLKINRATQTIEFWDTTASPLQAMSKFAKDTIRFFDPVNNIQTDLGPSYFAQNFADGSLWQFIGGQLNMNDGLVDMVIYPDKISINGTEYLWPTSAASTIATQSYVDNKVAGLLDLRGNHDASGNAFPTTGGSGTSGAILKGDLWLVSVAGVLNGVAVNIGDSFYAKTDSPTSSDWSILESNLGYVAENAANKTDNMTGNESNSTKYLSAKGVYDYLIGMTWLTDTIFGTWINARTAKTTPVDADMIPLMDSADSNKTKKLSWANFKATLKTYFDGLYNAKADYIKLTSAYTLASSTSLQKLFNVGSGSGGAYNAGANRTIAFECEFFLTGLSSSSGDLSFGVLGTAGISAINYFAIGSKNTALSAIASASVSSQVATATVIVTGANTGITARFLVHGVLTTSTAGTLILSVATGVATGSAQVGINSWAKFEDIGADTLTATSNIS